MHGKGVMQAKPTGVLNKDENDVVIAIIRPQDDENLEKVSCVPQRRLNCRDTMQKKTRFIGAVDVMPWRDF